MRLISKIKTIFLLNFVAITLLSISYLYIQKEEFIKKLSKRYIQLARVTLIAINSASLNSSYYKNFLKENKVVKIDNFKLLKDAKVLKQKRVKNGYIKILRYKNSSYILIATKDKRLLFKNLDRPNYEKTILFYAILVLLLITLYIWVIRSLNPLKELYKKSLEIKRGNLDISLKSDKNDEIAQLSNAFDDAIKEINRQISARRVFLRAIMHELKTPVAKGRVLNEFLESNELKDSYSEVFDRLELLIEEFSKIEQLLSKSYELNIKRYNILDILENSIEILMLNKEQQDRIDIIQNQRFIIKSDFNLLSIAIKNLIDNALKYSSKKIKIVINQNSLKIINYAKPLNKKLEDFNTPNFKDGKLSLGLYVTIKIIKLLNLNLHYRYSDGKNIFIIS